MKHCCFSFSIDLQSKTPKQRLLSSEACVTVVVRACVRVCACGSSVLLSLIIASCLSHILRLAPPKREK